MLVVPFGIKVSAQVAEPVSVTQSSDDLKAELIKLLTEMIKSLQEQLNQMLTLQAEQTLVIQQQQTTLNQISSNPISYNPIPSGSVIATGSSDVFVNPAPTCTISNDIPNGMISWTSTNATSGKIMSCNNTNQCMYFDGTDKSLVTPSGYVIPKYDISNYIIKDISNGSMNIYTYYAVGVFTGEGGTVTCK